MRCLVLDDDPFYLRLLSDFIRRTPGLVFDGAFEQPEEIFALTNDSPADVLFSDVEMPGVNGIDFVKTLSSPPLVVFMTSFPEFALKSYEVEAADFLTKPIVYERFLLAVGRCRDRLKARRLALADYPNADNAHFFVRADNRYVRIACADVLYFEGLKDYVQIYTLQGKYVAYLSLRGLEETLPEEAFIRVHRSYLVNRRHIQSIGPDEVVVGRTAVPLGMSYRDAVTEQVVFKNLLRK